MGDALQIVMDAYAKEVIEDNPDHAKLRRLEDAMEKLGIGEWRHCSENQ